VRIDELRKYPAKSKETFKFDLTNATYKLGFELYKRTKAPHKLIESPVLEFVMEAIASLDVQYEDYVNQKDIVIKQLRSQLKQSEEKLSKYAKMRDELIEMNSAKQDRLREAEEVIKVAKIIHSEDEADIVMESSQAYLAKYGEKDEK
jgi:hypothetical protein